MRMLKCANEWTISVCKSLACMNCITDCVGAPKWSHRKVVLNPLIAVQSAIKYLRHSIHWHIQHSLVFFASILHIECSNAYLTRTASKQRRQKKVGKIDQKSNGNVLAETRKEINSKAISLRRFLSFLSFLLLVRSPE